MSARAIASWIVASSLAFVLSSEDVGAQCDPDWIAIAAQQELTGQVLAITEYRGGLVAGGELTAAGGAPVGKIAFWNGAAWTPLGDGIGPASWARVNALAVYHDQLIAAGSFTTAGGLPANNIARWNGDSWAPLGSGIEGWPGSTSVNALHVYHDELIAAGNFWTAGGVGAGNIARWNGTRWAPVQGFPTGVNFAYALTVYQDELIVGGYESSLAGSNGTTFPPIFPCIWCSGFPIYALAVYQGELIAAGTIPSWGFGSSQVWIRRLVGDEWRDVGNGLPGAMENSWVQALVLYNDELVACGLFGSGGPMTNIARWNGRHWQSLADGLPDSYVVNAVGVYAGNLAVGGLFHSPAQAGGQLENWALWGPVCNPADINADGVVNVDDLVAVIGAWGLCAPPCPPHAAPHAACLADIAPPPVGDCVVDIDDLLMVISNWGP